MKSAAFIFVAMCALAASGPVTVRDLDGRGLTPLEPAGAASVLFFVTHDCPISNSYAPEIQHVCSDYKSKGVACSLVYVDPTLDNAGAKKHLAEFGYNAGVSAILDQTHALVDATHATITPEAVVVTHGGAIAYRGRIDNFYAGLGKSRSHAIPPLRGGFSWCSVTP